MSFLEKSDFILKLTNRCKRDFNLLQNKILLIDFGHQNGGLLTRIGPNLWFMRAWLCYALLYLLISVLLIRIHIFCRKYDPLFIMIHIP